MERDTLDAGRMARSTSATARVQFIKGNVASTYRARVSRERERRPLETARRRDRRLPSSQRSISILQLWCTLTFMHVDARLALNQLWDHGGQHGQESEKGEDRKEEDRKEEKEVVSLRRTLLRHIKARALLCHREADFAAA